MRVKILEGSEGTIMKDLKKIFEVETQKKYSKAVYIDNDLDNLDDLEIEYDNYVATWESARNH